jgi:hypothetical protein
MELWDHDIIQIIVAVTDCMGQPGQESQELLLNKNCVHVLHVCMVGIIDGKGLKSSKRELSLVMKNGVFWDVTPYGSCKNRRFGGTYRFLHQGDKNL